ncbi:MAG: hydrogenase subunit MbhD domain-containing protein [Micrococcaceae bacterium]
MSPISDLSVLPVLLAAAVFATAVLALYAPRRMSAVVLFLVFGVLLSGYWAMIGVPDVALAEAVIGTGVTGALFGWVTTLLPDTPQRRWVSWSNLVGLLLGAALGAGLGWALVRIVPVSNEVLSTNEPGLTHQVEQALPTTGVEHGITGVLLNLRSFDTLMEMVVLLVAVVVALAFVRSNGPAPHPQPVTSSGIDGAAPDDSSAPLLLGLFVRLVAPVALLLAAWILFAGSSQPGGAFQAGAAAAAVLILMHASRTRAITPGAGLTALLVIGVLGFVIVAVAGLTLGGSWLMLRGAAAGPVTVVLESLLAVSIGGSLAVVFLAAARGGRA